MYPVRHGPDIIMHTIDFATSSTVQWKFPEYDRLRGGKNIKHKSHTTTETVLYAQQIDTVLWCLYPKISGSSGEKEFNV